MESGAEALTGRCVGWKSYTSACFCCAMRILALAVLLSGCATAGKMNALHSGMSRERVVQVMGEPASVSAETDNYVYLNYRLFESDLDWWYDRDQPYFVRLVSGKVDAFGRKGDFDSTKDPTSKVKIETTDRPKEDRLDVLKKLHDLRTSGALTEEEYQAAKEKTLR